MRILAFAIIAASAFGDDPGPAELVRLLGSADRVEREEAARTLEELGVAALPALHVAEKAGPGEARSKAASLARLIEGRLLDPSFARRGRLPWPAPGRGDPDPRHPERLHDSARRRGRRRAAPAPDRGAGPGPDLVLGGARHDRSSRTCPARPRCQVLGQDSCPGAPHRRRRAPVEYPLPRSIPRPSGRPASPTRPGPRRQSGTRAIHTGRALCRFAGVRRAGPIPGLRRTAAPRGRGRPRPSSPVPSRRAPSGLGRPPHPGTSRARSGSSNGGSRSASPIRRP